MYCIIDGMLPRGRFSSNEWDRETVDNTVPNEVFAEKVRAEGQRFQPFAGGLEVTFGVAARNLATSFLESASKKR